MRLFERIIFEEEIRHPSKLITDRHQYAYKENSNTTVVLFSLMVNDIEVKHPEMNNLTKYADDLTVSAPVTSSGDSALDEVTNIESWASNNRMTLNFEKTWEMLLCNRSLAIPPPPINGIR